MNTRSGSHFRNLRHGFVLCGVLALGLAALGALGAPASSAGGNATTQLDLSDFLDAQGSADVWYPPEPALFAWAAPPYWAIMGWVDYAGKADAWLVANGGTSVGTTVSGTFSMKTVGDNLVEYTANVHAKDALAWCVAGGDEEGNWDGVTMYFGAHVYDVLDGAEPALGECHFKVSWRQAADEPIADVNMATNVGGDYAPTGFVLTDLDFRSTAFGPLWEASGLGEDGDPGKMVISQTGSNANSAGNGNGNADGFPAEIVNLQAVGN